MKTVKKLFFALFAIVFLLSSCSNSSDNSAALLAAIGTSGPKTQTGKITGRAIYSNSDDHSGIYITLDKTDGLSTQNVSRTVAAKTVSSISKSVVANSYSSNEGYYSFEGLDEGTYTIYASNSASTEKAVSTNVVVRSAQVTYADDLKLTATGSISGTVTLDGTNNGNMGFVVFVAGTSYMAITDDTGNYTISGVPAGSDYQVVAMKNDIIHSLNVNVTVYANKNTSITAADFTSEELSGRSIVWLGAFDSPSQISNPKYLNAYFNKTDGCSYIYANGEWQLLAAKGDKGETGKDGASINWRGSFASSSSVASPKHLDVYYNTTDGCSYIYINSSWQKLSSKGDKGNTGESGQDGASVNWRGSFTSSSSISNPKYLDAYYNTTDGCSYIYANNVWQKLSSKGDKGDTGETGASIKWRGNFASAASISSPKQLDAYYNTTDGCSYIYISNSWQMLSSKGAKGEKGDTGDDGTSINWRGSYSSSSSIYNPQKLDAYYNTTDGCSYIYNGSQWQILAAKGGQGDSIRWRGSYSSSSLISSPKNLDAYYNTSDGCAYIYSETSWILLARCGADGATGSESGGIRWRGSYSKSTEVPSPKALDAYFNTTDGCSYIYNGSQWKLLAQSGVSINWLGSFVNSNSIYSPKYLDAYFNTTENCAYIYNGSTWEVLAKGPGTGGSANPFTGSETGANVVGTTLVSWDNPKGVIRIPNGVKDISRDVFRDNDNITSVIIPSSVENIGAYAFNDCNNLVSVQFLGTGLKIIGENAFNYCNNLVSITLPTTLTTISDEAFRGCTKLTSLELPNKLETIGRGAFQNCASITTVSIPNSVVSLQKSAYSGCSMLKTLTIGNGLSQLKEYTFEECKSLVTVSIPDNVIAISESTFYGCNSLIALTVSGTWSGSSENVPLVVSYLTSYGTFWTWIRD